MDATFDPDHGGIRYHRRARKCRFDTMILPSISQNQLHQRGNKLVVDKGSLARSPSPEAGEGKNHRRVRRKYVSCCHSCLLRSINQLYFKRRRIACTVFFVSTLWWVLYTFRPGSLSQEVLAETNLPLDFVVAGFPKCGTTTLMYAFRQHSQVNMNTHESCSISSARKTTTQVWNGLQAELSDIISLPATGRVNGIKCPTAMYSMKALHRLQNWHPRTKWIVGLRHPVWQVQSFYNYRVTEAYDKLEAAASQSYSWLPRFMWDPQPSFRSLDDIFTAPYQPWNEVSRWSHRYELFLNQFGFTNMTVPEVVEWQNLTAARDAMTLYPHLGLLSDHNFEIFVYTVDQMEDANTERSAQFRKGLQSFLGLTEPLPSLGHENINHFQGSRAHPETIDICDSQWSDLRSQIIADGRVTATWIQDRLVASPHVSVSDDPFFRSTLDTWMHDPCP